MIRAMAMFGKNGKIRGRKMREQRSQELWQQIGEVWHLSLPAILTQITTIAMQYIDSAMVGSTGSECICCDRSGCINYLVVWRNYLCDSSGIFRTGRTSYWREKRERSQTGGMPWSAGCTSGIRNFVSDRTFHQRKTAGVAGR